MYWHFKSKEELYSQVCDLYCVSSISAIRTMLNAPEITFAFFKQGFVDLLDSYLEDTVQIDLVIDFYAEAKRSAFIHQKLLEMLRQREASLIALIDRLIEEEIIQEIDSTWTARALVSALMGLLFKYSLLKDKEVVMLEFHVFFNYFFQKKSLVLEEL